MIRSIPVISIVLICLLSFSMFGCGEADDLVEIPDDVLRAQIEQELYIRDDTSITAADMLRLTELDASRSGFEDFLDALSGSDHPTSISDLTGLQYAENLVVLDLDNNNIVNISLLAGLINLSELDLDDNNIVDISPLTGLINLSRLNLNDNDIVNVIPLTGLKSLNWLNLRGNNIVDISPLAGLKSLNWLDLKDNDIVDISPLAGLKSLNWLDIRGNPRSFDSKKRFIHIIEANGTEVLY